jgi:hypothetical protein
LIAACFAAAISTPDVGVLVHRHAGGDAFHVHAELEEHSHHHAEDHESEPAAHDHREAHQLHHEAEDHEFDGPGLSDAGAEWTWHSHATRPFHRAVASHAPRVAPARLITRLGIAPPSQRLSAATLPSRSRGPPPVRSS